MNCVDRKAEFCEKVVSIYIEIMKPKIFPIRECSIRQLLYPTAAYPTTAYPIAPLPTAPLPTVLLPASDQCSQVSITITLMLADVPCNTPNGIYHATFLTRKRYPCIVRYDTGIHLFYEAAHVIG
jgi:hypothetical protein